MKHSLFAIIVENRKAIDMCEDVSAHIIIGVDDLSYLMLEW